MPHSVCIDYIDIAGHSFAGVYNHNTVGEYGDFHAQYVKYLAKGISISNTAIVTMCSAISQLGAFIHAFRALTFAPARLSCAMFMVELITSIFDRLATLCACVRFLTSAELMSVTCR